MSRSIIILFFALLLGGIVLAGCSGASNVTAPAEGENPVKEVAAPEGTFQRQLWDIGEVVIDPVNQTVEIIRPRTADINCNVLGFCQPPGGPDSVSYKINWAQSQPAQGYIDVDVTLNHPFQQNMYWGHDVRLVIIGNGTQAGKYDNTLRYAKPTELRMLNPDGYTRWWNMIEFSTGGAIFQYKDGKLAIGAFVASARINPFKYFGDSVTKTEYPPDIDLATRGEFRSGHTNSRNLLLQFPKPGANPIFNFKYSIDASWSDPIHTPVDSSDDFDLQANCREAYEMKIDQTGSTVYWKDAGDFGGDLHLNIEIFDWKQGGGTAQDEIKKVVIESPTLFQNYGGFIDITATADKSPGTNANSVIFSYTVTNCTPSSQDNQEVLITVEDKNTTTYAPPFGSFSYPAAPLAAYHLYTAEVGNGGPVEKTITVVKPNGGETWDVGSAQSILWSSTGPITNVKIEYSEDGGATFPHLIVGSTPCDGNFAWDPIPDTPTDQAIVKISDVVEPTVFDVSDNVFTIKEVEKTITVTVPNGGEKWQVGTSHDITWESTGAVTNVKIEYYKDDDYNGTKVVIIASTPNDGSYTWDPIPDDPTTTAKVRISDVDDGAIYDDSDNFFEITSEPQEGWQKTLGSKTLDPQPAQGELMPDITVYNMGDPDFSRGQIMEQTGQIARIYMFSDDYSANVGTYEVSTSTMLDLTDWNRFDMDMLYMDVMGLCEANTTTPFPGNPLKDPGHCAHFIVFNIDENEDEYAGGNFGFWVYGDMSPDEDPNHDPEQVPWFHIADFDSGIRGGPNGDPTLDDAEIFSLMFYSRLTGQPQPNLSSVLYVTYQDNPYDGSIGMALGLPSMVTSGGSPGYVDDSNINLVRLAADDSSGLIAGVDNTPVRGWYILDALGRVHPVMTFSDSEGHWYIPYSDQFLGEGGSLGIDFGGPAVDIVVIPARDLGYGDWNWLCVLVDTGSEWLFKVYNMDFIGPDPDNPALTVTEVFSSPAQSGDPAAMDADNDDVELHILAKEGGTYKVTVWKYTQGG